MVTYTKHIVWRFIRNEPKQFKLLDVRHNVVKHLILGDCINLIKYILFGDDDKNKKKNIKEKDEEGIDDKDAKELKGNKQKERQEKSEIRCLSIPRNISWPGEEFLDDDDLFDDTQSDKLKDAEDIRPENNTELAIYHCKGKFNLLIFYKSETFYRLKLAFIYTRSRT